MKEIPVPLVRTNQTGIVLFVLLAAAFRQPLLIVLLWVIQVIGLVGGARANLFILLLKPLLAPRLAGAKTEAAELQRFNNSIAVILLTLSVAGFALGWNIAGYVLAGIVALAAFTAICGYCIGCTLYYQYKQFKARRSASQSRQ